MPARAKGGDRPRRRDGGRANDRILAHDDVDRIVSRSIPNPTRSTASTTALPTGTTIFALLTVEREERAALEIDDPASGRAIGVAPHGRRPGV
jgi:hypothetical protein